MSWNDYGKNGWKARLRERLPLIGVGLLAAAIIIGLLGLAGSAGSDVEQSTGPEGEVAAPSTVPLPPTSAPSTTIPGPENAMHPEVGPAERTRALETAVNFVRAWAKPDATPDEWRASIAPFMSSQTFQKFGATDPRDVPSSAVTGNARIYAISPFGALIDVPTDAGELRVTLDTAEDQPLVETIEPVNIGPQGPA